MNKYIVYVDGSCIGNPGPGGVGIIVIDPSGKELELSYPEKYTTNNKMELTAAILAIGNVPEGCTVELWTDSMYVKNGITQWIHDWKKKGWLTAQKKPVKNVELWKMLDEIRNTRTVQWNWVKAHNKHPLNERVDKLAYNAAVSAK